MLGFLKEKLNRVSLLLVLLFVVSFIVHFLYLDQFPAPPGSDYGNYLTQINIIHGYDLEGLGLRYPPVFFLVLDAMLQVFNAFVALKLLASLVFSVIVFPFYFLAKRLTANPLVSVVCAFFFVFFEGYSEMIAWGGNPNFLALSFFMFFLLFLVYSLDRPSLRNMLVCGFFMSLVVGTHLLVTVFLVGLVVILFVLFMLFSQTPRKTTLKVFLVSSLTGFICSIVYLPVYNNILGTSSGALVTFDILGQIAVSVTDFLWLFRIPTNFFVAILVFAVFTLRRYMRSNINHCLLMVTLLCLPFVLGLVTEQPARWFYFLPIPMFLLLVVLLNEFVPRLKPRTRKLQVFLVLFVVLPAAVMLPLSLWRLNFAVNYFSALGNDELAGLDWILEHAEPDDVFLTSGPNKVVSGDANHGMLYAWWIEGLTKHRCFMTGLGKWFTFENQRDAATAAQRIFAGTYVLESNVFRVADSSPSMLCNPDVSVSVDGEFHSLLFLNDAELDVSFATDDNPDVVVTENVLPANNVTMDVLEDGSVTAWTFRYELDNFVLTRTVELDLETSYADIVFTVEPINATIKGLNLKCWQSVFSPVVDYVVDEGAKTVTVSQELPTEKVVETQVSLVSDNPVSGNITVQKDIAHNMYTVTFSVQPETPNVDVRLRVSPQTQQQNEQTQYYVTYDLVEELDVDYIFLNNKRADEYTRLENDPTHYSQVFKHGTITIFKTNK